MSPGTRRGCRRTLDLKNLVAPRCDRRLMPRLSEFYGISIYMYFADHHPPHFHAIYAEHEAVIRILDGAVMSGRLPATAARLVEEWRRLHLSELLENWALAQVPAPLSSIEPLQ